jgi:hypothetical protein
MVLLHVPQICYPIQTKKELLMSRSNGHLFARQNKTLRMEKTHSGMGFLIGEVMEH